MSRFGLGMHPFGKESRGIEVRFSTDVDLLKWEPVLFRELYLPSQTLALGQDGELEGTVFSSASGAFDEVGISAGHVIYLHDSDNLDGCYEVVSVDSATELTVSVVRMSTDEEALAPPAGSGIDYRISTFEPQAEEVAYGLGQYFGLKISEGEVEDGAVNILNSRALRQASVFAVLSSVMAGSAGGKDDGEGFWMKSSRYREMFCRARARARLEIDKDSDKSAEEILSGGSVQLRRR